jgi:hypothetical protein
MSVSELFHLFVARHIVTGATGLLAFWVPEFAKKGAAAHRTVGKVFTVTMLLTGTAAIGTHPWFLYERQPAAASDWLREPFKALALPPGAVGDSADRRADHHPVSVAQAGASARRAAGRATCVKGGRGV